MRALVQRVSRASVSVEGRQVSAIGPGLLVLLGIAPQDTASRGGQARRQGEGAADLRRRGRPHERAACATERFCASSQFTLYADTRKGNRPGFTDAAPPEVAEPLYEGFCERLGARRGVFGARMAVELVNDGPVTLLLET